MAAEPMDIVPEAGSNLMWVEKYRPEDFSEIISHEHILTTVTRLIESNRLPHLLFYGPPGTGKTTAALAVARQMNGKPWRTMTLELNASDERGINVVRDRIKNFASTRQMFTSKGIKLVILDEADSMTNDAQFAMRRIMEQYTKNVRFILICNYVNKIIQAIQSRCTRFRFCPLERTSIETRLREIATLENVNMDEDAVPTIIDLCEGDMRKCLNILQSTYQSFPIVNSENVHTCTGSPSPEIIDSIWTQLLESEFNECLQNVQQIIKNNGMALADVLRLIHKNVLQVEMSPAARSFIVKEFGELEHRLSHTSQEEVQIASFVSIFVIAKSKMT